MGAAASQAGGGHALLPAEAHRGVRRLEALGQRVLRFGNALVLQALATVMETIEAAVCQGMAEL
nr:endonuclease domain-containing protein [Sphaerotilus sp. FB-5]